MKKTIVFITILCLASSVFAQNQPSVKPISQSEAAVLIGEKFGFKDNQMENLKAIGVTPLGAWSPEKPLTKDDLDAILVRLARRDPLTELKEPAELVDAIGFTTRDVSPQGIQRLVNSLAFRKISINLQLLLSPAILPLPPSYVGLIESLKQEDIKGVESLSSIGIALGETTVVTGDDTGDTDDTGDDGNDDDGDVSPPYP